MRIGFAGLLFCASLFAQTAPVGSVAGWGYRNASPTMEAAPGQVLIVSLHGARVRLSQPVPGTPAQGALLATTVSGISADLVQGGNRIPAGIYGVSQTPCPAGIPCEPVTNVTLQVPFNLEANRFASLEFKEGGIVLAELPVRGVTDRIHVITSCDQSVIYYSVFGGENLQECTAAVVRPRGGLNSPRLPARPGDELVGFAYGMGDADPSPLVVPFRGGLTKQPFVLRFAIAGGSVYWAQAPAAVALTLTNGTYQFYFTVPPIPDDIPLPACGERGVYGNMTVSISGLHSTDTFELCVAR